MALPLPAALRAQTGNAYQGAAAAANTWAGTTNLDTLAALNVKAGTTGLGFSAVIRLLNTNLSLNAETDPRHV